MRPEAVRARCGGFRLCPVIRSVSFLHRTPSLPCVRGGAPQGRRGCPTGMHRQAIRAGHAPDSSSCTVQYLSSLPCHPLGVVTFCNSAQNRNISPSRNRRSWGIAKGNASRAGARRACARRQFVQGAIPLVTSLSSARFVPFLKFQPTTRNLAPN